MNARARSTAPRSSDTRPRVHLLWLVALVAVAILVSSILPAPAGAAAKPKVSAGKVSTTSYCSDDGGEEVCTSVSHGTIKLLTVAGSRFTPHGMVWIQISNNGVTMVDDGVVLANGSGKFTFETDVVLCNGAALPYIIQAFDWTTGQWSNATTALAC